MKRIAAIGLLAGILFLGGAVRNPVAAQFSASISFQAFYDELDPYGDWIDYPDYGYVWHPRAGAGFRPYSTGGQWAWTEEYGWTWVSEFAWGWAPFHYGRWFLDPYYGWLWVPGYDWSPAWVVWRGGGDYYGWAPLSPGIRIGINFSFGHYSPPADYWCFAPRQYIASPRIYDHCVGIQRNTTIIHNTTIINERYHRDVFATGPSRMEVQRYTRQRIDPVSFRTSSRPSASSIRRNELTMYRPSIRRDDNRRYAPQRVERMDRNRRPEIADRQPDNRFRNQRNDGRFEQPRMEQRRMEQPRMERNTPRVDERMNRQRNGDASVFERRRESMRRNDMENRRNEAQRQPMERGRFGQRNEAPGSQPQRNFEQRRMEPGRFGQRGQEQRNVEPRSMEQRGQSQRGFEQRGFERRGGEQRGGGRQEGIRRENPGNHGGGREGRRGRD